MRKMLEGSKMARGRKKRAIAAPSTPKKPATLPQTIQRRTWLTEGSGRLCTTGPAAGGFEGGFAATDLATPALTEGVGVDVVFEAPESGATRAAVGVAAGKDLAGVSPGGASAPTVPEEARRAGGVTGVRSAAGTASPRAAASSSETEGRAPPACSSTPVLSPCSFPCVPDALSAGGVGLSF